MKSAGTFSLKPAKRRPSARRLWGSMRNRPHGVRNNALGNGHSRAEAGAGGAARRRTLSLRIQRVATCLRASRSATLRRSLTEGRCACAESGMFTLPARAATASSESAGATQQVERRRWSISIRDTLRNDRDARSGLPRVISQPPHLAFQRVDAFGDAAVACCSRCESTVQTNPIWGRRCRFRHDVP